MRPTAAHPELRVTPCSPERTPARLDGRTTQASSDPELAVQTRILVLRGQRVLLDRDLASLYGVTTKRLNEQVRRNRRRFPADFMFQLTAEETARLDGSRSQTATLKRGQNTKYRPLAFTEHGAIQAANVLKSDYAISMGVIVVRAFVRLRRMLIDHHTLAAKLSELDARVGTHDRQLAALVEAIRQLTAPPGPDHDRKIGFHRGNR